MYNIILLIPDDKVIINCRNRSLPTNLDKLNYRL